MEESIKKLLITVDEGIQFMRKSEYHMKVRGINDLCPAFVYPDLFLDSLTVGAVPVAAGIAMEFYVATVRTLGKIVAESTCFAVEDGTGCFLLDIRLKMFGRTIVIIGRHPDFLDHKFTHGQPLPSDPKDFSLWKE